MKKITMWFMYFLMLISLGFVSCSSISGSRDSRSFAGRWDYVVLEVLEGMPGCYYTQVLTRTYQLADGVNRSIIGYYTRRVDRAWIGSPPNNCVLPGTHAQPHYMTRFDNWAVLGTFATNDKQSVSATGAGCSGDCEDVYPLSDFKVLLEKANGKLYDTDLVSNASRILVFRDSFERQRDERNAAQSFKGLIQPLLNGECNLFYISSLASVTQARITQETFCTFGRQVAALVPDIIRDEPLFSTAPTAGAIFGVTGRWELVEGDVLVQRYFVLNDANQGIIISGVLRKQSNGDWKVLDLVPIY